MESNSAFYKKPLQGIRPSTSYNEQRKFLNFDFTEIKNSLNSINPIHQNQINVKPLEQSMECQKPVYQPTYSTKNYSARIQFPDSKQNTDISNYKQRNYQSANIRDFKPKTECLNVSKTSEVLTSMLSNDGKHHIISRCLGGDELKKATYDQITQSNNQKRRVYPLLVDLGAKLPNYQPTKTSSKKVGVVSCYSANTNIGISRNYNEDRVSIILNMTKQSTKCSIFAIYDGHGGTTCCDYLRDNLHERIIQNYQYPSDPKQAIINGVRQAEIIVLNKLQQQSKTGKIDKSGSCGIMAMIVEKQCFIANIGDSRAVLSAQGGRFSYNLSRDHKPIDILEQKRILSQGGKIYRTQMSSINSKPGVKPMFGPLRVFPGKLSVSRTFGDIQAKLQHLGGNQRVVVSDPQIKQFQIKENHDFIILGCDGIFDKIQSKQIVKLVWQTVQQYQQANPDKDINIHQLCGLCSQSIIRQAINRRSLDNLTVVMIAFEGFQQRINQKNVQYMTTSLKSMKSERRSPNKQYDV